MQHLCKKHYDHATLHYVKKIHYLFLENSNKVLGRWGWLMSIAAALSSFGTLNGSFFGGGRICFVAAREGHMVSADEMFNIYTLTF